MIRQVAGADWSTLNMIGLAGIVGGGRQSTIAAEWDYGRRRKARGADLCALV